ncbi:MAG: phosphate ABC transporter ATP-binding protein PstB [Methanomethylophilus sp.]|jgi:phosphate transport system ATP-binding protein
MTDDNLIMELVDVNVYYGDKHAVHNVYMPVREHSVTALIGASGCGKSTLLRCMNRMNDLINGCRVEGNVNFHGNDIYASGVDVNDIRTRIGMIFQKPNPYPMSIRDNIAYGPRIHGITKEKEIDEIVERTLKQAALWDEVKDRLKKSALGLSGGQQQRLCIARALAVNPEVLLMDEPTSALDPIATSKIEDLVRELRKDYTVVIVTHNMQQARRISDHTGFMQLGDMVEFGETRQIFEDPQNEITANYIRGIFG